jgi:hypothetical protein
MIASPSASIKLFDKKILLTLPWGKMTNPMTAFCVAQLCDKRRTSSLLNFGDAFVAHSRNSCADHFLKSGLEWQLTIDDDMLLPFGNAQWFNGFSGFNLPEPFASFNTIDRLMSHGKTLVGALYFGRHPNGPPVMNEGMANPQVAAKIRACVPKDELLPTRWVGTGCLLIHRSVYEDIEKRFPNLARGADKKGGQWFSSSEHTAMDWITKTRDLLSNGPMTGEKCVKAYEMLERAAAEARSNSSLGSGEDVQFCIRAKESGHQAYVDLGLLAGHIGHCIYGPKNTVGV